MEVRLEIRNFNGEICGCALQSHKGLVTNSRSITQIRTIKQRRNGEEDDRTTI